LTRKNSALRRISAIAGAALAGTAAALVMASPASAHHTTITGEAVCADQGGYEITWTVENSEKNKVATVESVTTDPDTPVAEITAGAEIEEGGSVVGTQVVPLDTKNAKLTVKAKWQGAENTSSGEVTKFPKDCAPAKVAKPSASFQTACEGQVTVTLKNGADATGPAAFTVTGKDGFSATKSVEPGKDDSSIVVPAANSAEIKVTEGTENTPVATGERAVPANCGALPVTGVALPVAAAGAAGLVGIGAVLFIMARRRRVRFTAS
jgi:hypothetical protein